MSATPFEQGLLPGLFTSAGRRARLAELGAREAVRLGAEVLLQALNAMAFSPSTGEPDAELRADARFRTALAIALSLSLSGSTARREVLMAIAGRAVRLAREKGVAGPSGRAIEAARLLCIAVLEAGEGAAPYVERVLDLAIEAEVLAGCVHGQEPSLVRAAAEARALRAAQPHAFH